MGAFDSELYALGYRSNRVEIDGLTIKDNHYLERMMVRKYQKVIVDRRHEIMGIVNKHKALEAAARKVTVEQEYQQELAKFNIND